MVNSSCVLECYNAEPDSQSLEIYMPLKQPLLPMKLLKIRNLVACVIVGSVGQMVYYALNVLWPIQITSLFTQDNLLIGIMSVCDCAFGMRLIRTL